jgi:PHD/YefM family antitoxin component YafN of YafNO toxin-antitoxin module
MSRTVTKKEAASTFEEIIDSLPNERDAVIVDDEGERVAVIVTPEDFDRYSRARAWETVRRVQERNADRDSDEVLHFVTELVEQVRRERNEKRNSAEGSR